MLFIERIRCKYWFGDVCWDIRVIFIDSSYFEEIFIFRDKIGDLEVCFFNFRGNS